MFRFPEERDLSRSCGPGLKNWKILCSAPAGRASFCKVRAARAATYGLASMASCSRISADMWGFSARLYRTSTFSSAARVRAESPVREGFSQKAKRTSKDGCLESFLIRRALQLGLEAIRSSNASDLCWDRKDSRSGGDFGLLAMNLRNDRLLQDRLSGAPSK